MGYCQPVGAVTAPSPTRRKPGQHGGSGPRGRRREAELEAEASKSTGRVIQPLFGREGGEPCPRDPLEGRRNRAKRSFDKNDRKDIELANCSQQNFKRLLSRQSNIPNVSLLRWHTTWM